MDLVKGYASNSSSSEEADFVGRSGVTGERETDMVAVTALLSTLKLLRRCKKTFHIVTELVLVGNECFWE